MRKSFLPISVLLIALLAVSLPAQVLHSTQIKQSLAFYHTHLKRLVYSIGPDTVQFVNDFVNIPIDDTTGDPVEWTTTVVEVGAGTTAFASLDGSGGWARVTTAANEDDGGSYQLLGEAFELTSDQILYFGAFGVTLNDATQTDFFLGLAITDTAILGGVTDRIGFECLDAATDIKFMLEKDSTETLSASLGTLADAGAVDLEFYWSGSTIEVFIDGSSVATPAVTNLPDDEALRVSWEFLTGEAVANTMDVDAIRVIQIGR